MNWVLVTDCFLVMAALVVGFAWGRWWEELKSLLGLGGKNVPRSSWPRRPYLSK